MEYYEKPSGVNKKWLIIISIFILIVAIVGYVTYLKIQKPSDVVIDKYAELNIMTIYGGELVETGFSVYENNNLIYSGKTSDTSATRIKSYYNRSIIIENYNLEGDKFLIESVDIKKNTIEVQSIKIHLTKRPEFDVRARTNLNNIRFTIENGQREFGELYLFLKSNGIILTGIDDYEQVDREIVKEMGFYKAYKLTDNFEQEQLITLTIPYISVNNAVSIEYCIGGLDKNKAENGYTYSVGLGECDIL